MGCKNICCAAYVGHGTKLLEQAACATAYFALGWTHSPKEAAASTIARPTGGQCFWFKAKCLALIGGPGAHSQRYGAHGKASSRWREDDEPPTMDPMNSSKRSSLLQLYDQASLRIRPSRIGLTLFRASRF